jgi:hypothetical protein
VSRDRGPKDRRAKHTTTLSYQLGFAPEARRWYESLSEGICLLQHHCEEHSESTERGQVMSLDVWLPKGRHYDLHIEHDRRPATGPFTGGGWKMVWHTTEGLNLRVMQSVLKNKSAEPHFLIGKDGSEKLYTVVQFLPLDQFAKALEHPSGTPETNRANCIQVEICQFAQRGGDHWPDDLYNALAHLALLVEHRVDIPRKRPRIFSVPAKRYTGAGFIRAKGHVGHGHAASQPGGHWDPGHFNCLKMFKIMDKKEKR